MNTLETLENTWGVCINNPHKLNDVVNITKLICKNVLIDPSKEDVETIYKSFEDYLDSVVDLYNKLKSEGNFEDFEVEVRINRLLALIHYSKNIVIGYKKILEQMDLSNDFRTNDDTSCIKFSPVISSEGPKLTNLILFLLDYTYTKNYAKYNDACYEKIYVNGVDTCAWKYVCEIQDLVYNSVNKNVNYEQFINITTGNVAKNAIEFLSNCVDAQFPKLVKDRRVFSFRNGIYFAKCYDEDKNIYYDKFVKYEHLKTKVCSSKFFDQNFEFPEDTDWKDIDTPVLDSIMEYQDLSKEVIEWVYVFIGRLIYEVNELDGWQTIFFFQGQAGTGKSTLTLNVCKELYDEEDVGVVSNNIQKKFGLADIVNNLMFVAPEIKRDFSMEQGEFQSIISGDKVTINIKHMKSSFINWKLPGIMAGNETPDFVDNSGSIQRRIVTLKFDKKVKNSDMTLGKKLKGEMNRIIKKCNMAYLEKANTVGQKNVWTYLPEYFTKTQRMLAQATNSLVHFLENGKLEISEGSYVPEKIFIQEFNEHCITNNYKRSRFNPDFYSGPFSMYGIKVSGKEKRKYPETGGRIYTGTFFENIKFVDDNINCDDTENNYDCL